MHLTRLIFRLLSAMCLYANPAFIRDFTVVKFVFSGTISKRSKQCTMSDVECPNPKSRVAQDALCFG